MHTRNAEIVAKAKEYVGTKFKHLGRSKDTGIDCVGLVISVARDLGLANWDISVYKKRPNLTMFNELIRQSPAKMVSLKEMKSGDFVCLTTMGYPVHVGIVEWFEDRFWLIHATARLKQVVREPLSTDSVSTVWRFPESN